MLYKNVFVVSGAENLPFDTVRHKAMIFDDFFQLPNVDRFV